MTPTNRKTVLTTGEVARICHVAPRTVSKWFDSGKLRGYRIPGSRDRRIPRDQLVAFMRAHGMPLDGLDGGVCRVLIIGETPDGLIEALNASGRYEAQSAANEFEAGVLAEKLGPHAILVDVDGVDAAGLADRISSSGAFGSAQLVAACGDARRGEALLSKGFNAWIAKPFAAVDLARAIEDATNLIT